MASDVPPVLRVKSARILGSAAPTFVFYLSSDWERFHRPDMVSAFARCLRPDGGAVLLVDRPVCPLTGALRAPGKWRRWLAGRGRLERLEDNLYLCRPWVALDDRLAHGLPPLLALNRALMRRQIDGALRTAGLGRGCLVTWFHFPIWVHYVDLLGEQLRIYECYDEHSEIAGLSRAMAARIRRLEAELFRRVDLVFATSASLLEAKRGLHPRLYRVPNAADAEWYARVQDPSEAADAELARLPRPVLGYLGTLNEHTDLALLRGLAEARPGWSLVLAGKIDQRRLLRSREFRRLRALANVRLLGWVERSRLISVCKVFDVCLIPYRQDSRFNPYVNPNKLHEYTAMGKPIVALAGPELDSHRDQIWIAQTPHQFVTAVEEAYRSDSPARIAARLERARQNTWDDRARQMLEAIADVLPAGERALAGTVHAGSR